VVAPGAQPRQSRDVSDLGRVDKGCAGLVGQSGGVWRRPWRVRSSNPSRFTMSSQWVASRPVAVVSTPPVRKHACIDGPEIDAHCIDWDKFLPRFGLSRHRSRPAGRPTGGEPAPARGRRSWWAGFDDVARRRRARGCGGRCGWTPFSSARGRRSRRWAPSVVVRSRRSWARCSRRRRPTRCASSSRRPACFDVSVDDLTHVRPATRVDGDVLPGGSRRRRLRAALLDGRDKGGTV